jgi:glycosyltransferase involved in cell wall biosynthesis
LKIWDQIFKDLDVPTNRSTNNINNPLVSVIIPFYNGLGIIKRAIDSIIKQTYTKYEIIIVDDGSSEDISNILSEYKRDFVFVRQSNTGCLGARNTGLSIAKGQYIAFLDQDDWWLPEKLSVQVKFMQNNPSYGLVFSNLKAVNKAGTELGFNVNRKHELHAPSWEEILAVFPVYPSSSLIRAELFNTVKYDIRYGFSGAYGDQDFHLRLREITEFYFIDECLGFYYWDGSGKNVNMFLTNFTYHVKNNWKRFDLDSSKSRYKTKFVNIVGNEERNLFRRLLEENKNIANKALLERIIEYNRNIYRILGKAYSHNYKSMSLDLTKFRLNNAVCSALYLFLIRPDLQDAFPEVRNGDLKRYDEWIDKLSKGESNDFDNTIFSNIAGLIGASYTQKLHTNGLISSTKKLLIRVKEVTNSSLDYISKYGLANYLKAAAKKVKNLQFSINHNSGGKNG